MNDELLLGLGLRDKAAAANQDLIEKLVPLARWLAHQAGEAGVTVADVRLLAEQRGLLPESKGRRLSWLGAVMPRAGLKPAGWRRSFLAKSHGNLQRVYRAA
jgi:hypothetical protein